MESSHTETVFDMEFKPDNKDVIASGSFDGTVRLFNITTGKCTNILAREENGKKNIVYSISWSPKKK